MSFDKESFTKESQDKLNKEFSKNINVATNDSLSEKLQNINIEESKNGNISTNSLSENGDKLDDALASANSPSDSSESACNIDKDPDEELKLDEHFIDENLLKEIEANATEDEKISSHQSALDKKQIGNIKFKEELYEEAACLYTEGLRLCPLSFTQDRAILYANRAAARSKLGEDQMEPSIADCSKAISLDPSYVKAIQRRANLSHQLDHLDEALKDYETVLQINPDNKEARDTIKVLKVQIEEKNEKLKAEMMGKLKDLGNMILKPFGLSTENFQLNQNPETQGYNINFKQNPS